MIIFAALVYFAFRKRFDPAAHKRLIFIATISLMEAAINRWPFPIFQRSPFMIDIVAYSFLLLLVAYDLWSTHRVNRVTILGGLFLVVIQELELPIGSTAVWQSFATWVLQQTRSFHGS